MPGHPKIPLLVGKVDRETLPASVRRRLEHSRVDVENGRVSPSFETAEESIAYLRGRAKRKR